MHKIRDTYIPTELNELGGSQQKASTILANIFLTAKFISYAFFELLITITLMWLTASLGMDLLTKTVAILLSIRIIFKVTDLVNQYLKKSLELKK